MDIQVGDKVTYKDLERNERYVQIVNYTGMEKDLMNTKYYEILKIERPKYEVIEEKKELLAAEEKEFLKQYIKIIEGLNNGKVNRIVRNEEDIFIVLESELTYKTEIGIKFKNLERDKRYTLEELGLEKN